MWNIWHTDTHSLFTRPLIRTCQLIIITSFYIHAQLHFVLFLSQSVVTRTCTCNKFQGLSDVMNIFLDRMSSPLHVPHLNQLYIKSWQKILILQDYLCQHICIYKMFKQIVVEFFQFQFLFNLNLICFCFNFLKILFGFICFFLFSNLNYVVYVTWNNWAFSILQKISQLNLYLVSEVIWCQIMNARYVSTY